MSTIKDVIPLTPLEVEAIIKQLNRRKPNVLTEIERLTHTVEALGLSVEDLKKLGQKSPTPMEKEFGGSEVDSR